MSRSPDKLFVALVGLFLLSGATSLVYEVAWVKVLTLEFGASAWSIATVVASFMAGLGLGGAWGGRLAARVRKPLRAYAQLEFVISLFGLVSLEVLGLTGELTAGFHAWTGAPFPMVLAVRFLICFVVLLVPTFLMGATLPILVVGLSVEKTFAHRVGLLYGANTLGAALGTFGAGVYGLLLLGVSGTVQTAAGFGFVISAAAWLLGGRLERTPSAGESVPSASSRFFGVFPIAAFLTGAVAVFYQISWTRLLVPVVGSSTYAFTIILTTVLLGIGLGGLALTSARVRSTSALFLVGLAVAAAGLFALVGLYFVNLLPEWFGYLATRTGPRTGVLFLAQAAVAGAIILLPTCCLGVALPAAIVGQRRRGQEAGRSVGFVYAANTFGSIVGSVLAGFVLLPRLGAAQSVALASGVALVFSLACMFGDTRVSLARRAVTAAASCVLLAAAWSLLPGVDMRVLHSGVFRTVQSGPDDDGDEADLVYVKEGRGATVTVARGPDDTVLKVNGKPDASSVQDLRTQYLLAFLPLALHAEPSNVCVVGYGSGATVYAAAMHPLVTEVDVVEIEEAVVDASPFFRSINHDVLEDSRVSLFLEDGRTFLRYGEKRYDVIISEPSNPWIAGVSSLFSSEYYQTIRGRLRAGGVFCQWIQLYELSAETLAVMLHTLAVEFPYVAVFYQEGDLICVAANTPVSGTFERYEVLFRSKPARRLLKRLDIHDGYDLFAGLMRSFPANANQFDAPHRNTDDNLWLEYRAPLEMYQGASSEVEWILPEAYLENLVPLFPGATREHIALRVARRFSRTYPELGHFIHRLAEAFADDPATFQKLEALAREASARDLERESNTLRLATVEQLLRTGRAADAVPLLQEVLAGEPQRGAAHRALGRCLIETGDLAGGARALIEAVRLYPEDYESRTSLAWLILKSGQRDVDGQSREALRLNPQYVPAWRVLIEGLTLQHKRVEARAAFREARSRLEANRFARLEEELTHISHEFLGATP